MRIFAGCFFCAIVLAVCIDVHLKNTERVEAREPEVVVEPREVRIEVIYNWDKERIEEEIRKVFPEDGETAVKIAKCESGLRPDVQSNHQWRGERERSFGIFQIHYDSWHNTAIRLGYEDYQTDVLDNLHMARHIYDNAGGMWTDWSCFTKKMI